MGASIGESWEASVVLSAGELSGMEVVVFGLERVGMGSI
jgi:hypothetical protein